MSHTDNTLRLVYTEQQEGRHYWQSQRAAQNGGKVVSLNTDLLFLKQSSRQNQH